MGRGVPSPAFARLTGIAVDPLGLDEAALEALLRRQTDGAISWLGFAAMQRDSNDEDRHVVIEIKRPTQRVLELRLREGKSEAISQVLALRDVSHAFEVDRMKSEFLSMAAHELRTPMAVIATQAHVLLQAPEGPARARASEALMHAVERAAHLSEQLLTLAALEEAPPPSAERQDLMALLQDCLAQRMRWADETGVELSLEGPDAWVLAFDRQLLWSALGNVLDNALKFSQHQPNVTIAVRAVPAERGAGWVAWEVQDNGVGFNPERAAGLFGIFQRLHRETEFDGVGAGLAVCRAIAERHGACITATAAVGQGCTVRVEWPAPSATVMD
eukprot:gene43986-54660_t